jgi:hypothetical protein
MSANATLGFRSGRLRAVLSLDPFRPFPRYPVLGLASIIDCPIHRFSVALDNQGRICSACPQCQREAGSPPTKRGPPYVIIREAVRTLLQDAFGGSLALNAWERDQLYQEIRWAHRAGETAEAIARAAGLSRQRIQQIVRGKD